MANEQRVTENAKSGSLTPGNSLTNSGTTMVSSTLAQVAAIGATQHYPIVLDPLGTGNGPEIAWITSHGAASTGATIVRGREGTTGVAHTSTTAWVHGPTVADFIQRVTAATRPSTGGLPFEGQIIYEVDTNSRLIWTGTAWTCLTPKSDKVLTSEFGPGLAFTDLATVGPTVTITTGTTALVTIGSYMTQNTAACGTAMGFAVSGATTLAASDALSISKIFSNTANTANRYGETFRVTGLTAGSNTFTAKYKATVGGSGTWSDRHIIVVGSEDG